MLETISWSLFLQIIGFTLILYYTCILWVFYRDPMRDNINAWIRRNAGPGAEASGLDQEKQKESRASSPTRTDLTSK